MAAEGHSFVNYFKRYTKFVWNRYRKLHILGKLFIWLVVLSYIALGIFIIIATPARIAQYLYDKTRILAANRFGWLALGVAIVIISFPPLVGHTTLTALCGFAYGMRGFFISSTASVVGSAITFVALRYLFSERLRQWSGQNEKWQALESVVKAKGLLLVVLIRVSPFPPWVYSNSLFASIEAVELWQFVVATFFVFPKLLLHTFIGSKVAELSDGDQREHMDTRTKVLNSAFIVGGLGIAVFTSWWVYTLVQRHIRHLDGFPADVDELAAEAIEDFDEEDPLLSPRDQSSHV